MYTYRTRIRKESNSFLALEVHAVSVLYECAYLQGALKGDLSKVASQAAWYRMENGPKSKNAKKLAKNRKWPPARNGEKMAPKWQKKWGLGPFFNFFAIFGPFFPYFGPRAIFYLFGKFAPISGFRPVFHSMPGGLTRLCGSGF